MLFSAIIAEVLKMVCSHTYLLLLFRSQRTCRIRSLLLFCKMSPCSHWHWCLSLRRSRLATNIHTHSCTDTCKSLTISTGHVVSHRDTTSAPKRAVQLVDKCGCELTFLTFLPFALSILSAEELLHVCEQCGGAEAHGKRGGWGCPGWSGARTRGHTRRSR